MSRRRQLSEEERALWSGFVRAVKPLRRPADSDKPSVASAASRKNAAAVPTQAHETVPSSQSLLKASSGKPPPLAPLGRKLKQRVARGREQIDARIDLHGYTQQQAHAALLRFLQHAQADGARLALVVTGKGAARGARDPATAPGVLKRQVPIWLSLPEFRLFVLGFEDAHVGHGGQGALYVRLRRPR